jgi:hypothetical protein
VKRIAASACDAGVTPTIRPSSFNSRLTTRGQRLTTLLAVLPTPPLPASFDVAHAPDGANRIETRRFVVRVETDVLARLPEMGFAREEIFDLERFPWF